MSKTSWKFDMSMVLSRVRVIREAMMPRGDDLERLR